MLDLADPDTYAAGMPHEAFRHLRASDPVSWREEPNGSGYWAVVRYHDAVSVLRQPSVYSSWRGGVLLTDPPPPFLEKLRESMMNRDPPDHTRLRRLVNRALSPRRIERLEDAIAQRARHVIDTVRRRGECDFALDVAEAMPLHLICEILGVPEADRTSLYRLTMRMFGTEIRDPTAALRDKMDAAAQMRAYGADLCRAKLSSPGDDLATELALEVERGALGANEFEAFFMLLFNAGTDTTRSVLCHGLDLLLDRPDVAGELRANPSHIPSAVEEILRYEPPVIQIRRTAMRESELGGKQIAEGDKVVVFFPSANRDETVFAYPDVFDFKRAPNDHISFGFGTHHCLGAPLARLEAKHVFTETLAQLRDLERMEPTEHIRTNFVRGVRRLRIRYSAA